MPGRILRTSLVLLGLASAVGWTFRTSEATAVAQRGAAPASVVKEGVTIKVADHTYVIPDGNVGGVPNVGIVVGNRGTLVIDPGLGRRSGEAVLREVAKVSRNPEVYIAKAQGRPVDEIATMLQTEFQAKYPTWARAIGVAAAARAAYDEAP